MHARSVVGCAIADKTGESHRQRLRPDPAQIAAWITSLPQPVRRWPPVISIPITVLPHEQLPTVFSIFGPALGASTILGPIVVGLIINVDIAGQAWRLMFLINIVFGTIGFVVAMRVPPHDEPIVDLRAVVVLKERRPRDPVGRTAPRLA